MIQKTYKDLQKRLEFVLILALFFPVILDAMYKTGSNETESAKMTLMWGLTIAFLVGSYLLLEVIKNKIWNWSAKYIDIFLLIEIAAFLPILYILALAQKGPISYFYTFPLGLGIFASIVIPSLICLLLSVNGVVSYYRNHIFK